MYCDIPVFSWLLRFVKSPQSKGANAQHLTHETVLPILISSNFLQMEELVKECMSYISKAFTPMLLNCPDLGSLSDELVQQLAKVRRTPVSCHADSVTLENTF